MSDQQTKRPESDQVEKAKLGEFVETNQKLLSVLGIFTALTVFSLNLPLKMIGYALAFVFLAIAVLLWFELLRRIPEHQEWPLTTFGLISMAILLTIMYWLLEFRPIWHEALRLVLMIPIAGVVASSLLWGIERVPRLKKEIQITLQHRLLRLGFYCVLYVVVVYASLFLASVVSLPLNRALDSLRKGAEGPWSSPESLLTNAVQKAK